MWYTPWAFQKYETQEAESRDSEREQRKKRLEESLKDSLKETRALLRYASIMRCLPIEMAKQRIHNRYKCFADLNQ